MSDTPKTETRDPRKRLDVLSPRAVVPALGRYCAAYGHWYEGPVCETCGALRRGVARG